MSKNIDIDRNISESSLPTKKYLMNRVVVIIKQYPLFGLVKVRYKNEIDEFIIDSKLLLSVPDNSHTISLKLLGGL